MILMIWKKPATRATIALALSAAFAVFSLTWHTANAQAPAATTNPDRKSAPETIQTFYLANATEISEFNDITTNLRNMIPWAKTYAIAAQFAITVRGTQEELDAAQKLITSVDRPRKVYRLTYTITDSDNGKRTGAQKFVVLATTGQRSTFKQGTRVPIVTGMFEKSESAHENTQVQYVDVGLMIDATVTGAPDALSLRSKIEQTSIVEESSAMSEHDPKIRQTVLDESFQLVQGKPLVLASFDIPGSTRRQEIEVVAEMAK
jgi:type II secretory pathway component GspD/PulD (secretin)